MYKSDMYMIIVSLYYPHENYFGVDHYLLGTWEFFLTEIWLAVREEIGF